MKKEQTNASWLELVTTFWIRFLVAFPPVSRSAVDTSAGTATQAL